ncbi:DUF3817 domain-containing protein [Streptomyces sp. C8S0]|uniref:DUF3817 domain-containing protein n=1 Tax=Streptomyces sp. C8S0 TaxID=2585716 RepID=UPI00299F75E8|nr:DUF3817 domain-containing protein [Streptomyces sp. C8S0]
MNAVPQPHPHPRPRPGLLGPTRPRPQPPPRSLRLAAAVEAASLLVLLLNLVTVHAGPVTSLGGPVHGAAYLAVVALTFAAGPRATAAARWCSLLPGAGGLLVLRLLR